MYVCVGGCLPIDPRRRESWLVSSSKPQSHQSSSRGGLICCLPERISRFFVFPKYENPLHFRLHLHVRMNKQYKCFSQCTATGVVRLRRKVKSNCKRHPVGNTDGWYQNSLIWYWYRYVVSMITWSHGSLLVSGHVTWMGQWNLWRCTGGGTQQSVWKWLILVSINIYIYQYRGIDTGWKDRP